VTGIASMILSRVSPSVRASMVATTRISVSSTTALALPRMIGSIWR